jgi:anaerobic ribonucleoside-triphosphate reductase activating protein
MQSGEVLEDLKYLIQRLKTDLPDKDIWLYTGYYIDDLMPKQIDVVELCDVVVDGPYIEELQDVTLPFRGSSNQNIWKIEPNELNVTLFPDIL